MPHVSFLAECGNPGTDNTSFDLSGLELPIRPVRLTVDFDATRALAACKPSKTSQGIVVEADVPEQLLDCYPAIGAIIYTSTQNEDSSRTVTAWDLREVSLCATPNADPTIKTVREQQLSPPH